MQTCGGGGERRLLDRCGYNLCKVRQPQSAVRATQQGEILERSQRRKLCCIGDRLESPQVRAALTSYVNRSVRPDLHGPEGLTRIILLLFQIRIAQRIERKLVD